MDFLSRFFGREQTGDRGRSALAATPQVNAPSLQVLLAAPLRLQPTHLLQAIGALEPKAHLRGCEIDEQVASDGGLIGLVSWDQHVVRVVGFDCPMPWSAVETCVAPAHYSQEHKAVARSHGSHVLLYYAGQEPTTDGRYSALALAASALSQFGAVTVLNEDAHTSVPASLLLDAGAGQGFASAVQELPLLLLFCGFVKYEVEGEAGVWMRTYNAHRFALPDLATLAAGHREGTLWFERFSDILAYQRESGAVVAAGHTMQLAADVFLRFCTARANQCLLDNPGPLLVVETITAQQVNRAG